MKHTLCMNCEYTAGCTLKNGHPVMMCEEHKVTEMPQAYLGFNKVMNQKINVPGHFQGLCSNCDLRENCFWHEPETITFSCEHYQ